MIVQQLLRIAFSISFWYSSVARNPPGRLRATDEYKKYVLTAMRTRFRNISNVLQEGNDQQGGYLVPVEYDNRLIDVLNEENIMRSLATKITTSGEHKINIAATKPAAAWRVRGACEPASAAWRARVAGAAWPTAGARWPCAGVPPVRRG